MLTRGDLRPAQCRAIEEFKSSTGVQAVMGMGAGKTASALTAISDLLDASTIRAALVTAPLAVAMNTWPTEIGEWEHLAHLDLVLLAGTPAKRAKLLAEKHDVYVIGVDNIVWLLDLLKDKYPFSDPRWDLLVIDELSRFKSPRGARAKKLNRLSENFDAIWGLSGTPKPNGWEDQWMQVQLVSGGTAWGQSFDDWRRSYFRSTDYQQRNWVVHDFATPIIKGVIDEWSFTIPPDELTDIPFTAGDAYDTFVDLSDDALADLATLEKELYVELGRDDVDLRDPDADLMLVLSKALATGKMEQVMQGFLYRDGETLQTYKQVKLAALSDMLESVGGEPVLIPYYFQEDLRAVKSVLEPGTPHLGAGVTDAETARIIDAWNAGDIRRLPIHPASAGHGLNLQKGPGHRLIWYTPTWSAELYAQTVKRLARPGQKNPVWSHRIRARHWLDDLKVNRVEHKLIEQDEFIASLRRV